MMKIVNGAFFAMVFTIGAAYADGDYPIKMVAMDKVRATDGFWFDRIETNRTVTLSSNWRKCNETPRIANFTNAANRVVGKFGGIPFDDSDVYKVMEGTAYILAAHPDPELERYMDWLIGQIAKAQEPDGYLYTARTLGYGVAYQLEKGVPHGMLGTSRWSRIDVGHELYNVGHMYEAAVAWYLTTGKRNFLNVAIRSADLIDRVFGPSPTQLKNAPGHEEIELALTKLYRVTGERRYLNLAKHFIEMRGRSAKVVDGVPAGPDGKPVAAFGSPGSTIQNHMPAVLQQEAVGHSVRATYLYCGMADVAAITGDQAYLAAIDRLWENVVGKKMHLTGGVGSYPQWEGFGEAYYLPNDYKVTYLETCAAIGNALWNERMFRFHGDVKYADVLERIIYNGFLSGISLSGDEFFYPNPLASKGGYKRSKWFGCSCCPVNDVRFIPQIPSFAYATDGKNIWVNLFMSSEAEVNGVKLRVKTDYPWSGKVSIAVAPKNAGDRFALKVRVPGWARGKPVPSDLYAQIKAENFDCPDDGYLVFDRAWGASKTIEVDFPMPVKLIKAHAKVVDDRGKVAVERGPIVYCAEGFDNAGKAYSAVLPEDVTFEDDFIVIGDKRFPALKASNGVKLIPYFLWGNREPGNDMQVWFKTVKTQP